MKGTVKHFLLLLLALWFVLPLSAQSLKKKNEMRDSLINALTETVSQMQAKLAEDESTFRSEIETMQHEIDDMRIQQEKQGKTIGQLQSKIHTLEKDLEALKKGELDEYIVKPVTTEDTIVYLVQQYYNAKRWTDQLQYVLDSARVEPLMRRYYSGGYSPEKIKKSMISVDDEEVQMGRVTRVDADMYTVYMKRTEEGFKIDWQATTGTDEYSFEAFRAEKSTVTRQFRVTARLGSEFASDYGLTTAKYYNVRIGESAFVLKNSEAGRQLYEVVKDGYAHDVILQVRYEKKNIKSGYTRMFPIIVGFVKEGWSLEDGQ